MKSVLGLVLLAVAVIVLQHPLQAEIISIDVTIKSLNAKERSITVTKTSKSISKDIELEIGKKAKIRIDGNEASLDDVMAGQKATVSYESDLEVVTKIEVGQTDETPAPSEPDSAPVAYKDKGCRVVWTISETGDSILTISHPLANRDPAKHSMIRHDDGTIEFQYDLNTRESVEKVMNGETENVEFRTSQKDLLFKPQTVKGDPFKSAKFIYSKFVRLPLTIEYEFDFTEPSGGHPFGMNIRQRRSNTEFPFLNIRSDDDFKKTARIEATWHAGDTHQSSSLSRTSRR